MTPEGKVSRGLRRIAPLSAYQGLSSGKPGAECLDSKDGLEWMDLTQMTIISTTVGRNSLEEMN